MIRLRCLTGFSILLSCEFYRIFIKPSMFSFGPLKKLENLLFSNFFRGIKRYQWEEKGYASRLHNGKGKHWSILDLQSWAKYLEQSKNIERNWTRLGNFNICFCLLFEQYCQSFISGRETRH